MKRKIAKLFLVYFSLCFVLAVIFAPHCSVPPAIQNGIHTDYRLAFLQTVPRSYTTRCFAGPPIMIIGNQDYWSAGLDGSRGPKPIPRPGEWQLSLTQLYAGWPMFLPYLAFTTPGGWHFRAGSRWDDVDQYYTVPSFAIKQAPR